jgi:hypothetical protein
MPPGLWPPGTRRLLPTRGCRPSWAKEVARDGTIPSAMPGGFAPG